LQNSSAWFANNLDHFAAPRQPPILGRKEIGIDLAEQPVTLALGCAKFCNSPLFESVYRKEDI
jgi:hypothetical protein